MKNSKDILDQISKTKYFLTSIENKLEKYSARLVTLTSEDERAKLNGKIDFLRNKRSETENTLDYLGWKLEESRRIEAMPKQSEIESTRDTLEYFQNFFKSINDSKGHRACKELLEKLPYDMDDFQVFRNHMAKTYNV